MTENCSVQNNVYKRNIVYKQCIQCMSISYTTLHVSSTIPLTQNNPINIITVYLRYEKISETNNTLQFLHYSQCLVLGLSHLLLLDDTELDSIALRKRNHGLASLADHKHVAQTSSEFVSSSITNMHDIEGAEVTITMDNHTHTTDVVSLGDETQVAHLELDVVDDLVGLQVHLHSVVHLHRGVGIADRASIVRHDEGNLLTRELTLHHLAQLVLGLLLVDAVQDKTSLHIIQQTETVSRSLKSHHIFNSHLLTIPTHETSRERRVSADLAVHLHKTLHANHLHLVISESVLQTVADDQQQRKTLSLLVRTTTRLGSPNSPHLVEHPVLRGIQTLQVLLRTASLRKPLDSHYFEK